MSTVKDIAGIKYAREQIESLELCDLMFYIDEIVVGVNAVPTRMVTLKLAVFEPGGREKMSKPCRAIVKVPCQAIELYKDK